MSTAPISIRLPEKANEILDNLANELHITKSSLIKQAIMERIDDYLDSTAIDDAIRKTKKTYTLTEMKKRYDLED